MKIKKVIIPVLMACALGFSACGDDEPEESCDGLDVSGDASCPASVDAVATLCMDGESNAYYTYGGDKYECKDPDAEDCDDAISAILVELIGAGCSTKSADIETINVKLTALSEGLLEEVRLKSIEL